MAGVMPVAELATAFDRLAREYKGHQLPLQMAEMEWLEAARSLFHLGLAQLDSTPLAAIPGAAELIEQVGQAVDGRLASLHDDPQPAGAASATRSWSPVSWPRPWTFCSMPSRCCRAGSNSLASVTHWTPCSTR
jgi:hypothetical protein